MANEERVKQSDVNAADEDNDELEKLVASIQINDPEESSSLEYMKIIDELTKFVHCKSKALVECQKLAEYGIGVIKKKHAMQMRMDKVIEKYLEFGNFDSLESAHAKKHELEQQISPLIDKIRHCSEQVSFIQMQCEKDYPQERIEIIFDKVREVQRARATMGSSLQTDGKGGLSKVDKLNEEINQKKPILDEVEDLLKEARERQSQAFFLHRSVAEVDAFYARQALEVMVRNKHSLQTCLVGLEMMRELFIPDEDTMNSEDYQKDMMRTAASRDEI
ncbi:unnamed protein product [Litomosoides sigmodontis]|uniref:Uncharacterized protein n=1 Tax=Litomosoides sigmodontis TaxID=42156 RepID=A0A3P6TXB8_LITSI|nr:unnamed protein product [Litomosoides sigmodontis]